MLYRNLLMASAIVISVVGTACSDTTAPKNEAIAVDPSAAGPVAEFTFIKWFTTYPTMTGNTSLGASTFAGTITKRVVFANGVIVQLGAIYQVRDPSGDHSFTAEIEGSENLQTASAVLNGVVTAGWRVGAQVHVTFDVIRLCALATGPTAVGTCFQGTIRVQG